MAALYEAAAIDNVNGAGWGDNVFRVVAVVTSSHFAQEISFDLLVSAGTVSVGSLYINAPSLH